MNRYFNIIRQKIFEETLKEIQKELGDFELDESYFGAKRVRGKRGRGAAGKTPVFGLLKRGDKVFTKIVPNCSKEVLMPIIQGHILDGSSINTDGWKAYDGLILNGYDHHRVFHSKDEFTRGKCHKAHENLMWVLQREERAKFNGYSSEAFVLHLKQL